MQATTQKRLPMVTTKMDKLGTNCYKGLFNVRRRLVLDDKGDKVMGLQTIDGKLCFIEGGASNTSSNMENKLKGTLFPLLTTIICLCLLARLLILMPESNTALLLRRKHWRSVKNRYICSYQGDWYFTSGEDGSTIRQNLVKLLLMAKWFYLYQSGKQAKGELIEVNGVPHYYDANTLELEGVKRYSHD